MSGRRSVAAPGEAGGAPRITPTASFIAVLGLAAAVLAAVLWAADRAARPPGDGGNTPTQTPTPSGSATPTPERYALQEFGQNWSGFWSSALEPLTAGLTFVAGGVLALFVLARLIMELQGIRERSASRAERSLLAVLGWLFVIAAPVAVAVFGAGSYARFSSRPAPPPAGGPTPPDFTVGVLLALAALGIIGAVAVAMWLAAGSRVEITVASTETEAGDTLTRADVVSALRSLTEARRVELGTTVDVSSLATSLTALSDNPFVKSVQALILFLVGVVPWKVEIAQLSPKDASLSISRHGRLQSERRVSLAALPYSRSSAIAALIADGESEEGDGESSGAGGTATDEGKVSPASVDTPPASNPDPRARDLLATALAASIVLAMREGNTYDFDRALVGASVDSSVALRDMAVRWFIAPKQAQAIQMLDLAIEADPFNRLARWTLDWATNRTSGDLAAIDEYADRLHARLSERRLELGGSEAAADDSAYTSTLTSLSAVTRNGAALSTPVSAARAADVKKVRDRVTEWLQLVEATDANRVLRTRAAIDVLALDAILGETRLPAAVVHDDAVAASPSLAYSLACYLVRWADKPFRSVPAERLLDRGCQNESQSSFAPCDPELRTARDQVGYALRFPEGCSAVSTMPAGGGSPGGAAGSGDPGGRKSGAKPKPKPKPKPKRT